MTSQQELSDFEQGNIVGARQMGHSTFLNPGCHMYTQNTWWKALPPTMESAVADQNYPGEQTRDTESNNIHIEYTRYQRHIHQVSAV